MQFQITTLIFSLFLSPILAVPVTNTNNLAARQCVGPACANPSCVPTKFVPSGADKGAFCASLDMDTFNGKMNALWYCC